MIEKVRSEISANRTFLYINANNFDSRAILCMFVQLLTYLFNRIMIEEEKINYEILHEFKAKQNRLTAEGKMQKPQRIIRDFTPEEMAVVKRGRTIDVVFSELEKNLEYNEPCLF